MFCGIHKAGSHIFLPFQINVFFLLLISDRRIKAPSISCCGRKNSRLSLVFIPAVSVAAVRESSVAAIQNKSHSHLPAMRKTMNPRVVTNQ